MQEFRFRWAPAYRALALPFGVHPANAYVRVSDDELGVRFGPWSLRTPLANVTCCQETTDYQILKAGGPARLSFADRGVTFATNGDRGLCLLFAEPVKALDPLGVLRHPGATVTVADVDGLRAAVGR